MLFYGNVCIAPPAELEFYERKWLKGLQEEIERTSSYSCNVLINLTWLFQPIRMLLWILEQKFEPKDTKIWFSSSVDGNEWFERSEIIDILKELGYNISFVGFFSENWHSWIPYWLENAGPKDDTTLDMHPSFLYLCYNRKPRPHRHDLVNKIIENGLDTRGWITYQKGIFPSIDEKTAASENDFFPTDMYSRPNDLTSLGDIEVWKKTFSVIVTETDNSAADGHHISEKTWKPIYGMRPFFLCSSPGVALLLKKLGFYTPKDFFEDNILDECNAQGIITVLNKLKNLDNAQLFSLWKQQEPMLIHNKKRFSEIADIDFTRILGWPQL